MSYPGRSPFYRTSRSRAGYYNDASAQGEPQVYYAPYFDPAYVAMLSMQNQQATGARRMANLQDHMSRLAPFDNEPIPKPSRLLNIPMSLERLPFRRAMTKLLHQLEKARELYNNSKTEFDTEITSIKNYADEKTVDKLWGLKIERKKDDDANTGTAAEPLFDQFCDMESSLKECLQLVQNSIVDTGVKTSGKERRRIDAAHRMLEKVRTPGSQILDLLQMAHEGPEYCGELVSELDNLKTLISPSANGEAYKNDGDGNTDGGGFGTEEYIGH